MRRVLPLLVICGFTVLLSAAPQAVAQKEKDKPKGKFDPGKIFPPTEDLLKQIETKTAKLAAKIDELRKNPKTHESLPDVEIYLRGARNIVRFNEWYNAASGKWTLDALDRGLERAEQLASGQHPWTELGKSNVLRAYRSVIDGTAQPYGVTYPNGYGKDVERKWRVDIVLHGRNGSLTEVAFLNTHNGTKKAAADQDWVQIDIFGRGNNAYRWSGETDVFEALRAFFASEIAVGRNGTSDPNSIVLRGFSMGGAGTWHLGLHYPHRWAVMGPGAGFTTTHDYAWKGKRELPDYQERCLRIYDAVDYVENARMIPIVAYSGGDDPQKLAADNIEKRLNELKIDAMTHLVKPGVGHKFEADYFIKANALWAKHAAKGIPENPDKVSFVTYTTKYAACAWVGVSRLEKHYQRTEINAERRIDDFRISTRNAAQLKMFLSRRGGQKWLVVDGQDIDLKGSKEIVTVERVDGKWKIVNENENRRLTKAANLQGPIDDAFASGFVCVLGSGDTWHPATQKFVDAKVKAFEYDWGKHWRGELPTIGDYAVTPNEINDKHLVLFGDPQSNLTLAQMMPKLPLKWTKDEIEFAGQKYKSSEHMPVLIFPNPLNPKKYVVLNTGHTIPSEDYAKTNAMLFPRLGDYAILRMTPTAKNAAAFEVATAGLFDEFWQVEKK